MILVSIYRMYIKIIICNKKYSSLKCCGTTKDHIIKITLTKNARKVTLKHEVHSTQK